MLKAEPTPALDVPLGALVAGFCKTKYDVKKSEACCAIFSGKVQQNDRHCDRNPIYPIIVNQVPAAFNI